MTSFGLYMLSGPILYMGFQYFRNRNKSDAEKAKKDDTRRNNRIHHVTPDNPIPYAVARFAMDKAEDFDPLMYSLVMSSSSSLIHFINGAALRIVAAATVVMLYKKWDYEMRMNLDIGVEQPTLGGHHTVADILAEDDPTYKKASRILVYKYQLEMAAVVVIMVLHLWWYKGFSLFFRLMRVSWQWICVGSNVTNMSKRWIASGLIGVTLGMFCTATIAVQSIWWLYMFLNTLSGEEDNVIFVIGAILILILSGYVDKFAPSTYGDLTKKFLKVPNEERNKVLVLKIYDVVYRRNLDDIAEAAGRGAKKVNEIAEQRFWAASTVARAAVLKELNAQPPAESFADGLKKWDLLTDSKTGLGLGTNAVFSCKFDLDYEDVNVAQEKEK